MRNEFDISKLVNVETEQAVASKLVERFVKRRKELSITQKELATRSGVAYSSIRRFETTGEISLTSLIKIANAIDSLGDFNKLFERKKITNLKDMFND